MITVNMVKAKEIHRGAMRRRRAELLGSLDVEMLVAVENDDKAAIKTIGGKKQLLRDVTKHPEIEAAQTPDALKVVWPDILEPGKKNARL